MEAHKEKSVVILTKEEGGTKVEYHKMKRNRSLNTIHTIRRAQVKVGLINLCKGLFSLNARIYYKLKSGTQTISV